MKLGDKSLAAIRSFLENPTEQRCIYNLGTIYWSSFINSVTDLIHKEGDVNRFIEEEEDFLNAGVVDKVLENADEIKSTIKSETIPYNHLSIHTVTIWLSETIRKIYSGDKKDLLKHEIKNMEIQQEKIHNEIASVQQMRKKILLNEFSKKSDKKILFQIENLTNTDLLTFHNIQTQQEISKGAFFTVDNRREFVERTNRLEKEVAKNEIFFSKIKSLECKTALRKCKSQINELFKKSINCIDAIANKEKELDGIKNKESSLAVLEVENRVRSELEYLRDLVKLSAKRLRMESCSILKPGSKFFTIKELCSGFDRILEFDPRVFNNDRVAVFGKPSVLLVPGNGYGIYDWKYNRLIIPMVPQAGNFMTSIAAAIIEYRLDVDIDKKLLTSYQKLPEQKGTRSMFAMRSSLTKDYIKWMNYEYLGFKVLDKDTRKWFEQEIAPSRNDIFCSPQYQPFVLSTEEFRDMLEGTEKKLEEAKANPTENDLWVACILNYQQGRFKDSFRHINELLVMYPQHLFGYYNMGIVGMKIARKKDAIKGFRKFIERNPQSWWASIAQDHIRRLQIS